MNVFITGATGFFGSHLVLRLLRDREVHLWCLVRGTSHAEARLRDALQRAASSRGIGYDLAAEMSRVTLVPGDIALPRCGVAPATVAALRESSVVQFWHAAGTHRFEPRFEAEILRKNVHGTQHAVELARELCVKQFCHVSTAFVSAGKPGRVLEAPFDAQFPPRNEFEASKRAAETCVLEGAARDARVLIVRPSLLVESSSQRAGACDRGFYGYVRAVQRFKDWLTARMPSYFAEHPLKLFSSADARLDCVPVDWAADKAVEVARRTTTPITWAHLTSAEPIAVRVAHETLAAALEGVTLCCESDRQALLPVDRLLDAALAPHRSSIATPSDFAVSVGGARERGRVLSPEELVAHCRSNLAGYARERAAVDDRCAAVFDASTLRSLSCRHGDTLTYHVFGRGPVLVLVNAYGIGLEAWRRIAVRLADRYRIITWECRGLRAVHGHDSARAFGVDEHAQDLGEILRAEAVSECHVVAWCSGSKIAARAARGLPAGLFKSVVFVAPDLTPVRGAPELCTEWDRTLMELCATLQNEPDLSDTYLRTIRQVIANPRILRARTDRAGQNLELGVVSRMHLESVLAPFLSPESIRNYAAMVDEYFNCDVAEDLEALAVPIRFVVGASDVIADPRQAELFAQRLPAADVVRLTAAGHFLVLENAEEVAYEIAGFHANMGVLA